MDLPGARIALCSICPPDPDHAERRPEKCTKKAPAFRAESRKNAFVLPFGEKPCILYAGFCGPIFDCVPGTPQNAAHSLYKEETFIPRLGVRQCGDLS